MTDRKIDALVAEKVMGWGKYVRNEFSRMVPDHSAPDYEYNFDRPSTLPPYSTNAKYDYQVLKQVRENWDAEQTGNFCGQLDLIWMARYYGRTDPRLKDGVLQYEPGDYSRAALAALGISVGAGEKV